MVRKGEMGADEKAKLQALYHMVDRKMISQALMNNRPYASVKDIKRPGLKKVIPLDPSIVDDDGRRILAIVIDQPWRAWVWLAYGGGDPVERTTSSPVFKKIIQENWCLN